MGGETENQVSGWTVDTLKADMQHQIDGMRTLLDERYQTQTKALEAAFAAAERAVAAALLAAEKAVGKAETAAEKRFESVNEFRGQLNDIVTTLISRTEAEARITAIAEKTAGLEDRMQSRLRELESRVDTHAGSTKGLDKALGSLFGFVGAAAAAVAIIIALTR